MGSAVLRLDTGRITVVRATATALLFSGGMLYLLHDLYPAWQGGFALLAAAVHLGACVLIARRQPAAHRLSALYGHAAAVLLLAWPVAEAGITGWGITVAWLGTGVLVLAGGRLAGNSRARFWGLLALGLALIRLCVVDTPELVPADREGSMLFARAGLVYAIGAAAMWAAWAAFRIPPLFGGRSRPFGGAPDAGAFWPRAERMAGSLGLVGATALPLALVWLGMDDLFRQFVAPRLGPTSAAYAHSRGLGLTFAFAAYATIVATVSRRRREPLLLACAVALFGGVVAKMVVADLGMSYVAAGRPLVNARFATVAFLAACAFWLNREAAQDDDRLFSLRALGAAFVIVGHLLALAALSMEWVDFAGAHADLGSGSAAVGARALGAAALLAVYGTFLQEFAPRTKHNSPLVVLGALLLAGATGVWAFRCLVLHAPAPHPIAHFRFFSGAAIAGALFAAGRIRLRRQDKSEAPATVQLLSAVPLLAANALVIVLLTLDAHDFFVTRGRSLALPEWLDPVDARRLSFSVIWTLYAIGMVVAGFIRSFRPVRLMALVILLGTTLKVFVFDLAFLTGLYRVASFLTLGLILVGVAYAYQRHRQVLTGAPEDGLEDEADAVPEG